MKSENKILLGIGIGIGLVLLSAKKTNMSATNTGGVNNPGNLRVSSDKFLGETSKPGDTFKSFKDIAHGIRAMYVILNTYATKYNLKTIRGILTRYAPATENNTAAYIDYVAKKSGLSPDEVIPKNKLQAVVQAMSQMEGRRVVTLAEAKKSYDQFFA